VYGDEAPVVHHVTGLVTVVPDAYVPAVPPLQPVKLVEVVPVHETVPEDPNEMVLLPVLNFVVEATAIVPDGRVTELLNDVDGVVAQYFGRAALTEEAEFTVTTVEQRSSRRSLSRANRPSCCALTREVCSSWDLEAATKSWLRPARTIPRIATTMPSSVMLRPLSPAK
jgi:hypothetical protein